MAKYTLADVAEGQAQPPKKARYTLDDVADGQAVGTKSIAERGAAFLKDLFGKVATPKGVADTATAPISKPLSAAGRIVRDNPEGAVEAIPAAMNAVGGAVAGIGRTTPLTIAPSMALAGLTGAGAEGFRQAGRSILGKSPVPDSVGLPGQIKAMIKEGGKQALAEGGGRVVIGGIEKAGKIAGDVAVDLARRAQGFQKSQLASSKSWGETLRKIAQSRRGATEALERGDIPIMGGSEEMLKRSQKLLSEGSKKVKQAMETVTEQNAAISAKDFSDTILKDLNPRLPDELAVAKKIVADIKSMSTPYGTISPKDLDNLRAHWGKVGYRDKTVSTVAADIYRKSWKTAGNSMREVIDGVSPKLTAIYKEGLRQEEMANVALGGITNRIAREEGNYMFSLPGIGTKIQTRAFAPSARMAFRAGKIMKEGAQSMAPLATAAIRGATGSTSIDQSVRDALQRRIKNGKR